MRLSGSTFTTALFLLLTLGPVAASSQVIERRVRGVVADESGGVLPGVTVVANAADGQVLATAVTDGEGKYAIGPLAAGPVSLTFQLEGFAPAVVRVEVKADADAVVSQKLLVAPRSENVVVYGKVPVPPPPPPPLPAPPPPPPRPVTSPVPEHDRDSICGPAKLGVPESFGTLQSRRYAANGLYAKGDELIVQGGTVTGLQAGHNYVVRRSFRVNSDAQAVTGEHTSGLLQIVEAGEFASVAVVMYACDEMIQGDRLASFKPEPIRAPQPDGTPDFDHAAKILFADAGQILGAPRRMMVIDAGETAGLRVGQRLTLFRRRTYGAHEPFIIGNAVIVAIRVDSATIRVERVTDAISFGDWAAPERTARTP